MSDITREEFASAVAATIESVHHLYREVARLNVGLREALSEGADALVPVRGSGSVSRPSSRRGSLSTTPMVCCSNPSCQMRRRWMRRKTTTRKILTPKLIVVELVLVVVPWNSWPISHCWRSGSCYTTRERLDEMTG